MNSKVDEYKYLLTMFVYAMRNHETRINTLFRLIYIYLVSLSFFTGEKSNDIFNVYAFQKNYEADNNSYFREALAISISGEYITESNGVLKPGDDLEKHINQICTESEKVKRELQSISYFSDVIYSYGEDSIFTMFYKEPNFEDAFKRNSTEIDLENNKLKELLTEFETTANKNNMEQIDKYDVFISWLNFILNEYIKEKNVNE